MRLFSWLNRAKAGNSGAADAQPAKEEPRYNGVEIVPQKGDCCAAVRALAGQRFLAAEAPLFPLPGCDRPNCGCRYRHYEDRRTDIRRVTDLDVAISNYSGLRPDERRQSIPRGRRSRDQGR
jgi:hypothetical protein